MPRVNQAGQPIEETYLWELEALTDKELREVLACVLGHLRLNAYRTNATKHGNTVIELRSEP